MNHKEPSAFSFSSISYTHPLERCRRQVGGRPRCCGSRCGPRRKLRTLAQGPTFARAAADAPQQTPWAAGAARQPTASSAALRLWLNKKLNLQDSKAFTVHYTQLRIKEGKGYSWDA